MQGACEFACLIKANRSPDAPLLYRTNANNETKNQNVSCTILLAYTVNTCRRLQASTLGLKNIHYQEEELVAHVHALRTGNHHPPHKFLLQKKKT